MTSEFLAGLGALNVCALEQAHPDDGLLPMLSLGGQPVQSVLVFTTQLLPETHQHVVQVLMVGCFQRRAATTWIPGCNYVRPTGDFPVDFQLTCVLAADALTVFVMLS